MAYFPAVFGLLMASVVTGQLISIEPRESVRRVGDNLTVLCQVNYPIDSCRITLGPTQTSYRLRPNDNDANQNVIYAGKGLESGECGAHIRQVTEDLNGNISCTLPPERGPVEITATMRLVVARPPSEPHLEGPSSPSFQEGDTFLARCVVPDGRPAAKIRWYLDDNELHEGLYKPVITSSPGADLQTISQNISRVLSADDNNMVLTCRAEHEALLEPKEAKRQFIVYYKPKRLEPGTITIFGLKLGAEGRLNVTVRANPPPRADWTLGARALPPGAGDGHVTALQPLHLGGGYYNVTLLISQIEKEDVDRKYYLRVSNDLGSEEFTVLISTLDEPTGVELEAGAIVGIVIAVLLLLIAITLIVFAKATNRWCFAGRGRDNTKSSGESTPAGDVLLTGMALPVTDTESAVGGRERSRLAGLSARVRAVLPRPKDKVQATEAAAADTEDKPLSEEKKNVVYAELALGDQPPTEKPPPPSTEYAEIVYKDQKETKE
ncbi:fasciclin-3 isoform X2 [Plodia interpunctella]|uniref:fasciclin-3 isoform X2 n=1 Tax=Plodia interpunctella TaxID=58824 RepID=UPI002368BDAD|nr:fasciclin-3 isoform X2 [Plodia interpunctella]